MHGILCPKSFVLWSLILGFFAIIVIIVIGGIRRFLTTCQCLLFPLVCPSEQMGANRLYIVVGVNMQVDGHLRVWIEYVLEFDDAGQCFVCGKDKAGVGGDV
mgnify:CR=1 FL=1